MGLKDLFKKIFRKNRSDATENYSAVTAMQSDVTSPYSAATQYEAPKTQESTYSAVTALQPKDDIRLEKDSLKLGLAAGVAGRSIYDISTSLSRIESMMVTKDWLTANDRTQQLYEILTSLRSILESHDRHTLEKFESVEHFLDRLSSIAQKVPEPIQSELKTEIKSLELVIPLSPKMVEALGIVYEVGTISYKDLSTRLGYKDVSSLRSLLSHMLERTNKIEKFEKDGEKWIRVKAL